MVGKLIGDAIGLVSGWGATKVVAKICKADIGEATTIAEKVAATVGVWAISTTVGHYVSEAAEEVYNKCRENIKDVKQKLAKFAKDNVELEEEKEAE